MTTQKQKINLMRETLGTKMAVIKLQNVSKIYGFGEATTIALDSINLTVAKGEFIAIMGPSGSGKSTLMNIIGLLDKSTSGVYQLDSVNVSKLGAFRQARSRRDKIGFIFQNASLIPTMSVLDNVALPLAYKGITPVKRVERASKILDHIGLKSREYFFPNQLSGGQAQRVAIARALVNHPSIVLADEPTGNLDTQSSRRIMELLKEIHASGNTILMVTHNPDLTRYADRVILMRDGQIQYDDELADGEMVDLKKIVDDETWAEDSLPITKKPKTKVVSKKTGSKKS
jgi:putative ABC transport system ATP-binding protein